MKRKLSVILLCGIMVLAITGCRANKNEFEIGKESDIEVIKNDVSLSVKEGTLTNTGATFILKNNSDKVSRYGYPFTIEIKKNGKWHKINVKLNFILPVFELNSNESKEFKINWENSYGKFAKGDYRLIKSVDYEYEEGKYESFYVAAEFTIK